MRRGLARDQTPDPSEGLSYGRSTPRRQHLRPRTQRCSCWSRSWRRRGLRPRLLQVQRSSRSRCPAGRRRGRSRRGAPVRRRPGRGHLRARGGARREHIRASMGRRRESRGRRGDLPGCLAAVADVRGSRAASPCGLARAVKPGANVEGSAGPPDRAGRALAGGRSIPEYRTLIAGGPLRTIVSCASAS